MTADELKTFIKTYYKTMKAFAREYGISYSNVQKWCSGERRITPGTAALITEIKKRLEGQ